MTKEAKRERQRMRHEFQAACRERLTLGVRLCTTLSQQKKMGRVLAERLVSSAVSEGVGRSA